MAKPEWGSKHRCHKCGARFYDLQKNPILCPSCGVEHVPDVVLKSRSPQSVEEAPKIKKPVLPVEADEGIVLDEEEVVDLAPDEDIDIEDIDDEEEAVDLDEAAVDEV